MKVGITGHQKRLGIDWSWVECVLDHQFDLRPEITEAFSSLAEGADQVFAHVAERHNVKLVAVIPTANYQSAFAGNARTEYDNIRRRSHVIELGFNEPSELAFFEAGKYIVDNVDLLFAVWDAQPAKGLGGTADVFRYAIDRSRWTVLINPLTKTVNEHCRTP